MARENESEMSKELAVGIGMELKKLRKVRGAHRAYVTRTLPAARESVKKFRIDGNKRDLLKYKEILMDKKDMHRSLDEKILDIMGEECDGEACIQEVEESESILMAILGRTSQVGYFWVPDHSIKLPSSSRAITTALCKTHLDQTSTHECNDEYQGRI